MRIIGNNIKGKYQATVTRDGKIITIKILDKLEESA
jgi:hypothetical protein